jgi:hypothetical protein
MPRFRPLRFCATLALAGALLPAQTVKYGPAPGDRAVEFSLADQDGRTQTLRSLTGPKGLMLVFYRSADW